MNKVGEAISRIKNVLKSVKEDAFMTDRFVHSLIMKYAKTLIQRDNRNLNVFKNSGLFKEIPCLELITVDRVEACCLNIKTGCTFKRSKNRLPTISTIDKGYLIRSVTTLDYSQSLVRTDPTAYMNITKSTNFKYNTSKYFWIVDGYLFIPDVDWEAVRISAMFEENYTGQACNEQQINPCSSEQERELNVPEYLFSEIENLVRQEILTGGQIPSDGADDSQNILR